MKPAALVLLAVLGAPAAAAAQEPPPPVSGDAQAGAAPESGLFRRLFTTLAGDIKRLPSRDNLPTLLHGSIVALSVVPFDEIATERASSSRFLKASFTGAGKAIGREWVQGGGALAGFVVGHVWHKPRLIAASGDLIEAQIASLAVTQGVKFAVSRTRPDGEARSFPSGHASAAFATASTLSRHFGRKAAIPAYAVAIYTSLSRLQANSHYASDVVAGATIGIALGRTATIEVVRQRLQVAPAPVQGGMAVTFTLARD